MSETNFLVVKPDLRFKSAPDSDISINADFLQTQSEVVQYDRTVNVNLATLFDDERQKSTTFRPTVKFSYLYENGLVGFTDYIVYRDNLYYVNPELSSPILGGNGVWSGLPSYEEFEFIRNDVDTTQLNFITKSASSYNWSVVLSYPIENKYDVPMDYYYSNGTSLDPWLSGDGIPFVISLGSDNGAPIIQFTTPVKHGLTIGEWFETTLSYGDVNTFQVSSLGDNTVGSDEYIFNIYNVGFTGTTFNAGNTGTFKRIIDINNSGETKSKYYVRLHKIITNQQDSIVTLSGFELNPFDDGAGYQFSSLTPDNVGRIAKYQSSNAYNLTFEKDLEVINQLDNNKKPLSEVFVTFQNVGYFGLFNRLRRGWQFNMTPNTTNPWWDVSNINSQENNSVSAYTKTQGNSTYTFNVNLPRVSGDTMYGDWCEWNDITQTERVISSYMNKITYNQQIFDTAPANKNNQDGYYYQVHFPITLKVFSDYIETAGSQLVVEGLPGYCYFSNNLKQWLWRDIYPYGYIDSLNRGVDYPFINNAHYPFQDIIFRLYPEGASFDITELYQVVPDPIIDACE
jgi:hypothetical protein